jgi:glycosyltransferase involved in cell wall biosynthesis
MPSYINLADIVVMPSFGEGLARVYLETQACGRVLIASDTPAAQEVVDDGVTGLLFPTGEIDALAERCIHAVRDAGLRARIGAAARERVQRHEIAAAVTRYLGALESVVRAFLK